MSDEEGGWMDNDEDTEAQETSNQTRKPMRKEEPVVEKTEAQLLIEAKQKKHEEEDADRIREIEEARRQQREREDEELRRLKEKQAQRKKEREVEEQKLEEQKRLIEEKRRQEEEARKQQKEDEKRKKLEEIERKKAASTAAMIGGRNFVIEKDRGENSVDKFVNISKAKTEMSLNTGELQALKERTVSERVRPLAVDDLDNAALKARAEELWKLIVGLETSKYDLAERSKRQEYDLKEMNERQRQINQKKYIAQGLEPGETSGYPPKVQLVSKYERRIDRRTFAEKKVIFEKDVLSTQEEGGDGHLNKPAAKKREAWVKGKKPYSQDAEEDGDEENQENEEPHDSHQEVAVEDQEEE